MDKRRYWYNFKTGEYDFIRSPDNMKDYIPQNSAAQGLYDCYIKMGKSPTEASIETLKACVGEGE